MFFAKNRSIRVRLTSLFVTIFGVTLVAFSVLLFQAFVRNHEREFDVALYNYAIDVARSIDLDLFGGISLKNNLFEESEKVFPFALGSAFLQIETYQGHTIARSRNLPNRGLPVQDIDRDLLKRRGVAFRNIHMSLPGAPVTEPAPYRMVSYFIAKSGKFDFVLHIAVPMILLDREERGLIIFFAVSIPLVLLLATFGGLYFSRRALRPVNDIIESAKRISATSLSDRVPVPEVQDELRELSSTLNGLLDRLESSFRSQEQFVANASHQLRTPLAILQGELDVLGTRERSQTEIHDTLLSARQEIGFLSRMVEDLLILARVDAGQGSMARRTVRIDEILIEVAARAEKAARPRGITLRLNLSSPTEGGADEAGGYELNGDPDLLHCLFYNLAENAVKFSPDHSSVEIRATATPDSVRVEVLDQGPGIAPEERDAVFERFRQGVKGRPRVPGTGLGLAIASRIAELHGAKITIQGREPLAGSKFECVLPRPKT